MSRTEILNLARSTYGVSKSALRALGMSGVIPAPVGNGQVLFAWTVGGESQYRYLERVRVQYTVQTAFTDPVGAGRALGLFRLADFELDPGGSDNYLIDKNGGSSGTSPVVQIADTVPLSPGVGYTSGGPFLIMDVSGLGAAGDHADKEWTFGLETANLLMFGAEVKIGLVAMGDFGAAGAFKVIVEAESQTLPANYPQPT